VVGAHQGLGTLAGGGLRAHTEPIGESPVMLGQEGDHDEVRGERPVHGDGRWL
jgi:hypothetical protein